MNGLRPCICPPPESGVQIIALAAPLAQIAYAEGGVPCFIFIRAAQLGVYPILTLLVGLPRYRHADWVNVSRQKFHGLVGHDLIWCLYCDWMTGVYSLGAEMLRNVESFWCPIRFANGKKCDNCKLDFPDIHDGWVAPEGTMGDVVATLERMYGAPATADLPRNQRHPWFGHPVRIRLGREAT